MSITYALNSQTIEGGIQAQWEPIPTGQNDTGAATYSTAVNIARHVWLLDEMNMSDYETLYALRGAALTNITTTDYDSRNSSKQYTTAWLTTVSGQQRGIQMLNVRAEFIIGGL